MSLQEMWKLKESGKPLMLSQRQEEALRCAGAMMVQNLEVASLYLLDLTWG